MMPLVYSAGAFLLLLLLLFFSMKPKRSTDADSRLLR